MAFRLCHKGGLLSRCALLYEELDLVSNSAIWLGYLVFTQAIRVRVPVAEFRTMDLMLLEFAESVMAERPLGMSGESEQRNPKSSPQTWKQQRTLQTH